MTDAQPDTTPSGIAVLAEDEPTWEDGPFPVRGVALPEDSATNDDNTERRESDEEFRTFWPAAVVEQAAALFDGAKITDGSEHDPETAMEKPQPSPETIIGEITGVQYKPGVGVLYEGEVDDPEMAKRIQRGRVEVSPTIFRRLGEARDDGTRPVETIAGVRDLSIVAEGAGPGNSIEAAPQATAMSALSAAALSEAFDASNDTTTGADTPTDTGQPGDDGKSQSTVGPADTDTMTADTLTDDQRDLLASADRLDDPIVVESEHAAVLEAAAGCEEPHVVEQTEYQATQDDLAEAKGVLAGALAERTGLDAEKIKENFSWAALREEFEDDDGDISAAALVQNPETGQPEETGELSEDAAALAEEYGDGDVEVAVSTLKERHERFTNMDWDKQADEAAEQLDTLGVEV